MGKNTDKKLDKYKEKLLKEIAGERLLEENWHMTYNMGLEKAMEIIKQIEIDIVE